MPLDFGSRGQKAGTFHSVTPSLTEGRPAKSTRSICARRTSMKPMPSFSATLRTMVLLPTPGAPRSMTAGMTPASSGFAMRVFAEVSMTLKTSSLETTLCISTAVLLLLFIMALSLCLG